MSVALLLIGDGRDDVHDRCWESAKEHLPAVFDHKVVVDDRDHRLGFAGAVQAGWEQILDTDAEWVFHLEADFVFEGEVPAAEMIGLLQTQPHLAQVALKRQPCNPEEQEAGGIVEAHPDDFTERRTDQFIWTEHRKFWTTNPSVYSTRWCKVGWPQERYSEGVFTHKLLKDPTLQFAFWGEKFAPPLVEHVGDRVGVGY